MSNRSTEPVEFVRINGEAVRVTSWTVIDDDTCRLVAIVRGAGEARSLTDLLSSSPVTVEVQDQPARSMAIAHVDRRESGEPPAIVSRFAVDFTVSDGGLGTLLLPMEDRVTRLERELADLSALVKTLANSR